MADAREHQPDDDTIVLQMLDRQEEGLRALVQVHGPYIRGFLRNRWGRYLDDLELQAVFNVATWKAWKYIGRYDDKKKELRTWYALIAHRAAATARQQRKKKEAAALEDHPTYDPGKEREADAVRSPVNTKRLADLEAVINALPGLQQRIIRADLADASGQADSMCLSRQWGNPVNSIEVSRNKARKKIAEEMRVRGHFRDQNQRSSP